MQQSTLDAELEDRLLKVISEFRKAGMGRLDIILGMTEAAVSEGLGYEKQYRRIRALLLDARDAIREAKEIEEAACQRPQERLTTALAA